MHIGFYEKPHWKIEHVLSPELFYLALSVVLEEGSVIFFSSFKAMDESLCFLERHVAPPHLLEYVVPPGSSEPPEWSGHYLYSKDLQRDLELYFQSWNSRIADNVMCYKDGESLLWFHDALSGGDLELAPTFSQTTVTQFCRAMSPSFKRVKV